jgi:hypothetical protein
MSNKEVRNCERARLYSVAAKIGHCFFLKNNCFLNVNIFSELSHRCDRNGSLGIGVPSTKYVLFHRLWSGLATKSFTKDHRDIIHTDNSKQTLLPGGL